MYAQLITPDGTNHGLHAFVVPIRNTTTLLPFSGVIVGDMSEKLALNGVDNGFVIFQNYRIPRDSLLNKAGDVSPEGQYSIHIKDRQKRMSNDLSVEHSFCLFAVWFIEMCFFLQFLVYLKVLSPAPLICDIWL